MKRLLSLTISLLLLLFLAGCGEEKATYTATGYYFDTVINFSFSGKNARPAIDACLTLASEYDDLWNKNKPDSDIARINNSACVPVTVNEETITLLKLALDFAKATDGACSPAIGAVSSLWDFKSQNPAPPDRELIEKALSHTDYNCIKITDNTVTVSDSELKLDLGFIAKGYAADSMKKKAEAMGITSGWINLGGNVLAIGSKPDGSSFNIGIQNPLYSQEAATIVSVIDESVVTSGVYERFFEYEGEKYYHILDTKTGYPIRNNLLSVSIIGPSSAVCDGLSTALFILGKEEGLHFLEKYPGYKAIFITDDMNITYSTDTDL